MARREMQTVVKGAFILTVASFIAKLLSAVYRVPFQNLVGDEGFYVYQQVYPIYGLAMTFALTGLPQFISRYLVERKSEKERQTAVNQLFPLVTAMAAALWALTFFGAAAIAGLMGDGKLKSLIQVVSFSFLLVPGLSFYRGNFQSRLEMVPSAVSQVVEQVVRVGIILLAAASFQLLHWDYYQTGTAAMAGALFGGVAALVLLNRNEQRLHSEPLILHQFSLPIRPERGLLRRLLVEGGLLSIYSGYLILFQLLDSFFVTNALEARGMTEQAARIAKGVYDRGQPLVQLGLVVALGLSASFLPSLTKYLVRKDYPRFHQAAGMYLRLTVCLGAAAAVGLALLLPYMNYTLFKDFSGNGTLVLFVLSVALMAVIQAYQGIAQSQNRFRMPLKAALWGLLVKGITTTFLTMHFGTAGASAATLTGLLVTLLYLIGHFEPEINRFWSDRGFGRKLLLALLVMMLVLLAYYGVLFLFFGAIQHRLYTLLVCIAGVGIGGCAFLLTIVQLKLFTLREWLLIPFGAKLLKIKRKR